MARWEVVESKRWVNSRTGSTASPYGAVPWHGDADKRDWRLENVGWTVRDNNTGTVGIGKMPWKARAEAQATADSFNAEYAARLHRPAPAPVKRSKVKRAKGKRSKGTKHRKLTRLRRVRIGAGRRGWGVMRAVPVSAYTETQTQRRSRHVGFEVYKSKIELEVIKRLPPGPMDENIRKAWRMVKNWEQLARTSWATARAPATVAAEILRFEA